METRLGDGVLNISSGFMFQMKNSLLRQFELQIMVTAVVLVINLEDKLISHRDRLVDHKDKLVGHKELNRLENHKEELVQHSSLDSSHNRLIQAIKVIRHSLIFYLITLTV